MPRDARAYLSDILESCDAIAIAMAGMDVDGYLSNRLVRSSIERELTHEYPFIDDEAVWVIAQRDVPVLRAECEALLARLEAIAGAD